MANITVTACDACAAQGITTTQGLTSFTITSGIDRAVVALCRKHAIPLQELMLGRPSQYTGRSAINVPRIESRYRTMDELRAIHWAAVEDRDKETAQ